MVYRRLSKLIVYRRLVLCIPNLIFIQKPLLSSHLSRLLNSFYTALQWLELAALYRFNFQSVIRLLSLGCLNERKSHADLLHLFCITKFDEAGYVNFRTFHYEHIAQKVAAISYHLTTRSRSALTYPKTLTSYVTILTFQLIGFAPERLLLIRWMQSTIATLFIVHINCLRA